MILPDTSAWIAFLRGADTFAHRRLVAAIDGDEPLIVTDPVILEVLAGARSPAHHQQLRSLLHEFDREPVHSLDDYEAAAELYQRCRRQGVSPRTLLDCLIATVARMASRTPTSPAWQRSSLRCA